MSSENCSSSQQHALAEKSVHVGDAGSVVMRSSSKTSTPPHQASSRTQSERPDWIKQSRSSCHDRPERSHPFLILLCHCRTRRPNKTRDRLGPFTPLAGLGLRLEDRKSDV